MNRIFVLIFLTACTISDDAINVTVGIDADFKVTRNGVFQLTTIGGVLLDNIVISVTKGVVYVFNPLGANAKADDPFKTLQQI